MKWMKIHPGRFNEHGDLSDKDVGFILIHTAIMGQGVMGAAAFGALASLGDAWMRGLLIALACASGFIGVAYLWVVASVYRAWMQARRAARVSR